MIINASVKTQNRKSDSGSIFRMSDLSGARRSGCWRSYFVCADCSGI